MFYSTSSITYLLSPLHLPFTSVKPNTIPKKSRRVSKCSVMMQVVTSFVVVVVIFHPIITDSTRDVSTHSIGIYLNAF